MSTIAATKPISGHGKIRSFPCDSIEPIDQRTEAHDVNQSCTTPMNQQKENSIFTASFACSPGGASVLLEQQTPSEGGSASFSTSVNRSNKGGVHKTNAAPPPSLQDVIDVSEDGDCVYIQSGRHVLQEPLRVSSGKKIFIIGFDDLSSKPAHLVFDIGAFKLGLPLIRVDTGSQVSLTQLTLEMSFNVESSMTLDPERTFALHCTDGATLSLERCNVISCANAACVGAASYATFTDCSFKAPEWCAISCIDTGRAFSERCTFSECRCGVFVGPRARCGLSQCSLSGLAVGVQVEGHGYTKMSDCTIDSCNIGVVIEDPLAPPEPSLIFANKFQSNERSIYIHGEGCKAVITKNSFKSCGVSALCVDEGVPEISQNAIEGSKEMGIEILGGRPMIEQNIIEHCAVAAVFVSGITAQPTVLANDIAQSKPQTTANSLLAAPAQQQKDRRTSASADSHKVAAVPVAPTTTEENAVAEDPGSSTPSAVEPSVPPLPEDERRGSEISEANSSSSTTADAVDSDTRKRRAAQIAEMRSAILPEKLGIGVLVEDGAAPRIDGNHFEDNCVNVWVSNALGSYLQNICEKSQGDNFVLQGPICKVSLSHNEILGSVSAASITLVEGAAALIERNVVKEAKLAAIALRGSGHTEIFSNTISECQDAVVAMQGAKGIAKGNRTSLRFEVFTDAAETFTVIGE